MSEYKIANYYGLNYRIYSDGRIMGPKRGFIKQRKNSDGYFEVTLGRAKCRHARVRVHRLVAEQFIPNPNNLPEVNHIDFDRTNNDVSNLEWVSHLDNVRHSSSQGRYNVRYGDKNGRAKLNWEIVDMIRSDYSNGMRIADIAKKYSAKQSTVGNIVHFNTWTKK